MPTETVVIIAVITGLFVAFAITLAWAERQTHNQTR